MDEDMAAVIEVAKQAATPVQIGTSDRVWFVPSADKGQGLVVDIARYWATPPRKSGSYRVYDVASFNKVLEEQSAQSGDGASVGGTKIYVHRLPPNPAVVAVLNDHGDADKAAGWRDHRLVLDLIPTPQWQTWTGVDGRMQGQVAFAEFLEQNLADIVEPAGATMLEIATYLESKRDVAFRSGVRLNSGAIQFEHSENIEARVGAGQVAVPETFTIGIPVFVGLAPFAMVCRFRWRNESGKLTLGYRLQRLHDTVKAVVDDIVSAIVLPAGAMILEGQAPEVTTCGVMASAAKAQ
jgi:uncharacterized protein YfdQ (DUF2303 family)